MGASSKSQRGRSTNCSNIKNSVHKANKDGDHKGNNNNSNKSNVRSNVQATRRAISLRQASMRASLSLAAQFQSKVNHTTKVKVNNNNNSAHNSPTSSPTHKGSAGLGDMPDNVLALILRPLRQPSLNKLLPLRLTARRWNAVISAMCQSFGRLRLTIAPAEEIRILGADLMAVLTPPRPGWQGAHSETLVIGLERLNFPLAQTLHQLFAPTSAMLYLKGRVIQVWHKRPVPVSGGGGGEEDAPQKQQTGELGVELYVSTTTISLSADEPLPDSSVVEASNSGGECTCSSSGSSTSSKSSKSRKSKQKLVIRRVLSLRQASMKASQRLSNSLNKSVKSNSKVSSSPKNLLPPSPPLNINDLPSEMLFNIFRFLKRPTLNGLIRQRATCHRWNAVVLDMCRAIRSTRLRLLSRAELKELAAPGAPPATALLQRMPPARPRQETLLLHDVRSNVTFMRMFHFMRPLFIGGIGANDNRSSSSSLTTDVEIHFKGFVFPLKSSLLAESRSNIFQLIFESACSHVY